MIDQVSTIAISNAFINQLLSSESPDWCTIVGTQMRSHASQTLAKKVANFRIKPNKKDHNGEPSVKRNYC